MSAKTKMPRRQKRKKQAARRAKRSRQSPLEGVDAGRGAGPHPTVIELSEFDVTDEPLPDPAVKRLPDPVQARLEHLRHAISEEGRAAEHLAELESLIERYPHVPRLHNYLSVAYNATGRVDEARACIERMYQRFPDYLFAVTNYVRQCLYEDDVTEAGRVLDGRHLITHFARGRRRFHISEVVAYQAAVGEYLVAVDEIAAARTQLGMLEDLAPDHPQVRSLQRALNASAFERTVTRLARRARATSRSRSANGA